MKFRPLPLETRAGSGFTHVAEVKFTDLNTTAGLTKTLQLIPETLGFPAGTFVRMPAGHRIITPFVGAGITSLNYTVGDDNDTDRYITAQSLIGGTPFTYAMTPNSVGTLPAVFNSNGLELNALFTAVGANLTALTAGEIWLMLALGDLSQI
jgi:hypothetical protein